MRQSCQDPSKHCECRYRAQYDEDGEYNRRWTFANRFSAAMWIR